MKSVMNMLYELGEIWTQNFDAMNSEFLWPTLEIKVPVSNKKKSDEF